ncbi:response regulator transcription factor [Aestuariibacter sp. A3R04]|uniref:response regulator transcription factor n=1 Tax=Aestuariibacter sp. A3R04 TaxID=2841571 RepID=UPI001C07F536|nr:response regulator [Aestuariibacter sp. A3R04]MBU3023240.1 response regulator [Aestuariibacter sp. A3R04]
MTNTIIIIDDDPRFSSVLARRFEKEAACEVLCYESAKAALREPIPGALCILLDMMLGNSEIGLTYIEALKTSYQPKHLIIMTGYASIPTTVEAIKKGATDYLTKPVAFATLYNKLFDHAPATEASLKPMTPAQAEWEHIQRILHDNNGNISATAKVLGMHRRTLQRKLLKLSPNR